MNNLDVLIINPSSRDAVYQELGKELAAIEPPIWAAMLANCLRVKGYSVEIMDADGESITIAEAASRISLYNAKLIVIVVYGQQPSASTQNMYGASKLCSLIKENNPESKVLLAGGHVSALPQRTLLEEKADFVCQGEGPFTISGLLNIDMDDMSQYSKVPGLWYKDEGRPVFTYPAHLIPQEQLQYELPGMAFDLLPMSNYRAHNWHCFGNVGERRPYASLYTSLGCPYGCSFCCINAPFGKPGFRYWNPQFIIRQFDIMAEKYNVRNIKIADEMFVLNENHFLTLCRLLKERKHGFNIWAYARVDTVKPAYLEALKAAGVNWLILGIESGSRFVRDGVLKGRYGGEDIRAAVKMIKDAGINIVGNYIFGLPDDDLNTMQETLDMAIDLNCEMANFYSAMAYPGSKLYELALKNKWKLPDTWLGYSQHAYETLPLPTNHITAGEVLAFRDKAWKEYFTNPSYLEFMKNKFGIDTYNHISDMTRYNLKRNYAAVI